jgi:hypothetical protein
LSNDQIPLHTFLPPVTDVETFKTLSIITTKLNSGNLSTSVFFIRVSALALYMLTEAMAYIYTTPLQESEKVFPKMLQQFLELDNNHGKAIYQPNAWYDGSLDNSRAVFDQPCSRESSPAQNHVDMEFYLLALEREKSYNDPKRRPQVPDAEVAHPFWHSVSEARRVLNEAKERGQTAEQGDWREMVREVKDWVELRAWDTVEVDRRVEALKEGLDIR